MSRANVLNWLEQTKKTIKKAKARGTPLSIDELRAIIQAITAGVNYPDGGTKSEAVNLFGEALEGGILNPTLDSSMYSRLNIAIEGKISDSGLRERALGYIKALSQTEEEPATETKQEELAIYVTLDQLISKVVRNSYKSNYSLNILYTKNAAEFEEKIDEHNRKLGDGDAVGYKDAIIKGCFYSSVLKKCVVSPGTKLFFEKPRDNIIYHFSRLVFFENILHDVIHGLIDSVQKDEKILDIILEEYVASLCAHQITVDNVEEISRDISDDLYDTFVKTKRVTSLTPAQEDAKKIRTAIEGKEKPEQIARYLLSILNSTDGLKEIAYKNVS